MQFNHLKINNSGSYNGSKSKTAYTSPLFQIANTLGMSTTKAIKIKVKIDFSY